MSANETMKDDGICRDGCTIHGQGCDKKPAVSNSGNMRTCLATDGYSIRGPCRGLLRPPSWRSEALYVFTAPNRRLLYFRYILFLPV